MVICEQWSAYREDDVGKALTVRELVSNELWRDKVDYILRFMWPTYGMLCTANTDKPILHEEYDMWDAMIKKVKAEIYQFEGKNQEESVPSYTMINDILIAQWTKNCTPLHCLAHSMNPK